jgi:hypothetical protein
MKTVLMAQKRKTKPKRRLETKQSNKNLTFNEQKNFKSLKENKDLELQV